MQNTFTFHSSLPLGDLIYALAGIKEVCNKNDKKAMIYIGVEKEWGMMDPVKRNNGVTVTQDQYDKMRPLLMSQSFVHDVQPHEGQQAQVNLDDVMKHDFVNVPYGYIPRWYFYLWPDMACDLSEVWLDVPNEHGKMILINRTSRYHNPTINYGFLEEYRHKLLFIGMEDEWKSFCKTHVSCHHYKVRDFLHLATIINSCQLFIGNQSFCYAIAEALKVPRILELYAPLPNVIPQGKNGYDFAHQGALEYYVKYLMV